MAVSDSRSQKESIQKVEDEFVLLKKECDKFSFLAVGKTGAGKSTLLNALTGTQEFTVGHDRSTIGTTLITDYSFDRNGVTITVWDSPGFQDSSDKEKKYKVELKAKCSKVDLVLYCISLKETRSDLGEDGSALKQITDALGADVWKKSVITLTFANKLESRLKTEGKSGQNLKVTFEERIGFWKTKVREALQEANVDISIVEQIPVVPAGHFKRIHLPQQQYWLSNLWFIIFRTIKDDYAKIALERANEDRFVSEKNAKTSSPLSLVLTEENLSLVAGGTAGVTGAAVGGTVGAVVGSLALGIPTFGVGTVVGLALGLVVGGAVGGGVGAATAGLVKKVQEKRKEIIEQKQHHLSESEASAHSNSLSSGDTPLPQAGSES